MKKIEKKKITTNCECSEDCSYNQFSISQQENIIFERSAPRVFSEPWLGIIGDTQYGHFGTNAMDGLDFDETYWFNMGNENKICLHSPDVPNIYCICCSGEYIKDVDRVVLPQDPVLDHKFPRPITERSHCGGIWEALEEDIKEDEDELKRDCYADGYIQPLSNFNSEVRFYDNLPVSPL